MQKRPAPRRWAPSGTFGSANGFPQSLSPYYFVCFVTHTNNGCSYSTLEAEASLDAIAVRGIIAALDYARGLHTIRLVGLRRGNESMLTRDCLVTLVRALRSSPSVETLDLSDNSLRDSVAAQHLGALISRHSTIVCLLLANNCLGEVSGKMLLKSIR